MQELSEIGAALHAAAKMGPGCSRAELEALVESLEEQRQDLFPPPLPVEGDLSSTGPEPALETVPLVSFVARQINERNGKRYTPLHSALFSM
jgi:hypothetical protein